MSTDHGPPNYSTDIGAAFDGPVAQLAREGWSLTLRGYGIHWEAEFKKGAAVRGALGTTAPHAICLAALAVRQHP